MVTRILCGGISAVLLAGRLLGQVPAAERIPITEPDRLRELGFPRDARNVFVWSRADLGAGGAEAAETPQTWGTSVGYTTVYGYQLQPDWTDLKLAKDSTGYSTCTDNNGVASPEAFVEMDVPDGASLVQFRTWSYDADADQDLIYRVWETCQPYGYDPPSSTLIADNSTLGAIGYLPGAKSLNGLTVNNEVCSYAVQVVFSVFPAPCSGFLRVSKMQFSWARQVSPAPANASFGDVPSNDPRFQFVEALVKSGVTAGCGSGNYCPDAPLTRGQMAVFLSKALGLQWP